MLRWALLLAVSLTAQSLWAQDRSVYGVRPNGQALRSLAAPGTHAVVLFFVASDCPIANRTFPEMKHLREEFSPRGVRFWFVYANKGEQPQQVQQHQAAYDSGGEAVLDTAGTLAAMSGARVTPEVAVLVPDLAAQWRTVYIGRIDDRFVSIGQERPYATKHFAEQALNAVLSGGHVETATGDPIGCSIISSGESLTR